MRTFGRFAGPEPFWGELFARDTATSIVQPLSDPPWLAAHPTQAPNRPLTALRVLVPVTPSKIIAVGRNYHAHAAERGAQVPTSPLTWLKAPTSLLAHGGVVTLPYPQHRVEFEAELGIVIGAPAKNVSPQAADQYILGYTACQDISDRDIQDAEKQFARAKSFDTFTPVGPYIYSDVAPDDLPIICCLNGEIRQDGRTAEMIFGVREIVSFCSQGTTLLPGDLILTGTPAGVGRLADGDVLETRIGPFDPLIVHVRSAAI